MTRMTAQIASVIALLLVHLTSCAAAQAIGQTPMDQLPMYGGADRTVDASLKAADHKLISDTTSAYGSREKASQALLGNGFAFFNRDDLVAAMRRFNQAWLLDPNNPEVYWGFGAVLHEKGKDCEAMAQFQKALSFGRYVEGMNPDAALIMTLCALSDKALSEEARDKLFANADALYVEALEKDPRKGYVYGSMATERYWRGRYREAWGAVKLARTNGSKLPEQFLDLLRAKLADPFNSP
jgi:Tfp pilus assembly protein PilF